MKKIITSILIFCMLVSLASCDTPSVPIDTTAQTTDIPFVTPNKPTEPEEGYHPTGYDGDIFAARIGFTEGTYEYEYMKAMNVITFLTYFADEASKSLRGTKVVDNWILDGDPYPEELTKPYTSLYVPILEQANAFLAEREFAGDRLQENDISVYKKLLTYHYSSNEFTDFFALGFAGIDTGMIECAETLLSLSEKYPDYTGEFLLSEEARTLLQVLIDSCEAVGENHEQLFQIFASYFPLIHVTEEFDAEKDAVKITISGDGKAKLSYDSLGIYVEDFEYQINTGWGGGKTLEALPMDLPMVIYLPIDYYREHLFSQTYGYDAIRLDFLVSHDDAAGVEFDEKVTLTLDPFSYYSDEPITMQNDFLDLALREYFGGEYSERDLLSISNMEIRYKTSDSGRPYIRIHGYGDGWSKMETYYAHHYYDEEKAATYSVLPEELYEDICRFPALRSLLMWDNEGTQNSEFWQSLQDTLKPYIVSPEVDEVIKSLRS